MSTRARDVRTFGMARRAEGEGGKMRPGTRLGGSYGHDKDERLYSKHDGKPWNSMI